MHSLDEDKKEIIKRYLNDAEISYKRKQASSAKLSSSKQRKRKQIGLFQNGVYSVVVNTPKMILNDLSPNKERKVFLFESDGE